MRARPSVSASAAALWLGCRALVLGCQLLVLGCQSSPAPAPRGVSAPSNRAEAFDSARAWSHLEVLADIGPRPMGSEGAARARSYLKAELEKLGLETVEHRVEVTIREGEPFELVNLAGRIPGESDEAVVIAAGYDSRAVEGFELLGVNESASGPAVVMEMARILAAEPLPYTTWIVFLDGDAPMGDSPAAHLGADALGRRLAREKVLQQIRLLLVIGSVCDPELRLARDLASQRLYREEFWRAAARLGHAEALSSEAFESVQAAHGTLSRAGLRRVVVLADTSFGGDEPPGVYAGTADDDLAHCSAESLGIVGSVALEGLGTIATRLAKIDRFAASPLSEADTLAWDTLGTPPEAGEPSPGVQEAPREAETSGAVPEAAASQPPPSQEAEKAE